MIVTPLVPRATSVMSLVDNVNAKRMSSADDATSVHQEHMDLDQMDAHYVAAATRDQSAPSVTSSQDNVNVFLTLTAEVVMNVNQDSGTSLTVDVVSVMAMLRDVIHGLVSALIAGIILLEITVNVVKMVSMAIQSLVAVLPVSHVCAQVVQEAAISLLILVN